MPTHKRLSYGGSSKNLNPTALWNGQVLISMPAYVNFELYPGSADVYISCFKFDALAQGNAYSTKKPINYMDPEGIKLAASRLGQHRLLPAVPNLHATAHFMPRKLCQSKIPRTWSRWHWTTDNPSGRHTYRHTC